MASNEQKIVDEYLFLLEKSQQLFAGLSDLPQFGKQWLPYFQRTFEVFTRLWKFQQTHRSILERKDLYGIKRSEIGEIASKIGQLYYHFYLRTSETKYLSEVYIFYEAIRTRAYFKDELENTESQRVKKLRYYSRFIVVCLLLEQPDLARELATELTKLVQEHVSNSTPSHNVTEWQMIVQEITQFLGAYKSVTIAPFPSLRLPRLSKTPRRGSCKLQEAILVGAHQHQIKFSELTLDMFRMMLALEYYQDKDDEPAEKSAATLGASSSSSNVPGNVHKYLLYRPSLEQVTVHLATALKDLHDPHHALLLYLSADGVGGGVGLQARRLPQTQQPAKQTNMPPHALYPFDLAPYTRRPLFLVVDSDNSLCFKAVPHVFGQPLLCLLSPTEIPHQEKDSSARVGNLFTLFLTSPLLALCHISRLDELTPDLNEKCCKLIGTAFDDLAKVLTPDALDFSVSFFLEDEFTRSLILRFLFCHAALALHIHFKEKAEFLPTIYPSLPNDILMHPVLMDLIYNLATVLKVSNYFDQRG